MDYKHTALEMKDYVINTRRYLHEHPELSGKEENTVAFLDKELTRFGIEHVIVPEGGILCFIRGKGEKTVLLRADIDALPVTENECNMGGKKKPVVSKVPGVAHMCGHDAHATMLLCAAKILNDNRDRLNGTVIACFERGEEATGNVRNILAYIQQNNIHIDACFGIHIMTYADAGDITIAHKVAASGLLGFEISIKGKGGHGSRPDIANNPIDCFTAIYNALSHARSREVNPYGTFSYSIGLLTGGTKTNVIPDEIRFGGTARFFDEEHDGMNFKRALFRIVDNICAAYECTSVYHNVTGPLPAVANQDFCVSVAEEAAAKVVGREHVKNVPPMMATDSFAYFTKLYPSCYLIVGCRNKEKGIFADHHHPSFDLDEDAMFNGIGAYASIAETFLSTDGDLSYEPFTGTLEELFANFPKVE